MSYASEVGEQEQVCLYGLLIQVAHVEEGLSKFYFGAIFPRVVLINRVRNCDRGYKSPSYYTIGE